MLYNDTKLIHIYVSFRSQLRKLSLILLPPNSSTHAKLGSLLKPGNILYKSPLLGLPHCTTIICFIGLTCFDEFTEDSVLTSFILKTYSIPKTYKNLLNESINAKFKNSIFLPGRLHIQSYSGYLCAINKVASTLIKHTITQWFSKFNMCMSYLGILLKCRS